jgi:hypothetical protein
MTGAQLLDMVMQRLGNRTDVTLRAALAAEMAAAQEFVLEQMDFVPWFLDSTVAGTATLQTESVDLPTGFLGFDEEIGYIAYDDPTKAGLPDTYTKLLRGDADRVRTYYSGYAYSPPKAYWIVGMKVYLRPIPDIDYTLQFRCSIRDVAPTDTGTTNLWLTHAAMLLLAETGRVGASLYLQNPELAVSFTEEYKRQKDLLWKKHEAHMIALREVSMNGEGL